MTTAPLLLRAASLVFAAGAMAITVPQAVADALVVEAKGVDLKPGTSIADGQRVAIPSGGSLQVILQSGATLTVQGPYAGTVGEYSKSRGATTGLENSPTRGIGATRGATR